MTEDPKLHHQVQGLFQTGLVMGLDCVLALQDYWFEVRKWYQSQEPKMMFLQEIEQSIDSDITATGQSGKKINENIRDRAIKCNPK